MAATKNQVNNPAQKIQVICPANAVTAGPEALHQLVACLNQLGISAAMVYHPFDQAAQTPTPYAFYQVPVEHYQDVSSNFILFPEIMPMKALQVKNATAGIWWMSVNNYTCVRYINPLRDKIRYLKNLLKGKRPWRGIQALQPLQHFAQSAYAYEFLQSHQINAHMLSDPIPYYTEMDYLKNLANKLHAQPRADVVLYNPKKGWPIIKKLIQAFPQLCFKPVQNLNREALAQAFLTAKIYVDFGHHPGKDRLPREAALHGACVITGRFGSAANLIDIPILEDYKLNTDATHFTHHFELLVKKIFNHFTDCQNQFAPYRSIIAKEPTLFKKQILAAFRKEK